jgi:hypothetical protein
MNRRDFVTISGLASAGLASLDPLALEDPRFSRPLSGCFNILLLSQPADRRQSRGKGISSRRRPHWNRDRSPKSVDREHLSPNRATSQKIPSDLLTENQ